MSHEVAFLVALGFTLNGSIAVTMYLHGPLRKLLLQVCDSPDRVAFWTACNDVVLLLLPLLGLLLGRERGYNQNTQVFVDLLWAPMLGLVLAVLLIIGIVAILTNIEPAWDARVVPKEQRDDLKRLLSSVNSIRAREILVRDSEVDEEPEPLPVTKAASQTP